jgi:hypothetical protein
MSAAGQVRSMRLRRVVVLLAAAMVVVATMVLLTVAANRPSGNAVARGVAGTSYIAAVAKPHIVWTARGPVYVQIPAVPGVCPPRWHQAC